MKNILEKLKKRYPKHLHQLFKYGTMGLLGDDGNIAYKQQKKMNLSQKDMNILFKMAIDNDFDKLFYNYEDEESEESLTLYAPCHALMVLAEFKSYQFSNQLMRHFDTIDEEDDSYLDALAYFFVKNFIDNIDNFRAILDSNKSKLRKKIFIFQIFEKIIKYFREDNNISQIEKIIIEFLKNNKSNHTELNKLALSCLIEIDGLEHIDLIRWCFDNKDMGMADLEEIEHELGLRKSQPLFSPNLQKNRDRTFLQWFISLWRQVLTF